jgi:hypothetical protein
MGVKVGTPTLSKSLRNEDSNQKQLNKTLGKVLFDAGQICPDIKSPYRVDQ